jgi:4'-phosphopantetheinyl transferase EntD
MGISFHLENSTIEIHFLAGKSKEWEEFLQTYFKQPVPALKGKTRQWPTGHTGSVSHCDLAPASSLFVGAFGSAEIFHSIGVDIEPVMSVEVAMEVKDLVANETEYALLKFLEPERAVTTLFSAKEAIYKLISFSSFRTLDFSDVALVDVIKKDTFLVLKFLLPEAETKPIINVYVQTKHDPSMPKEFIFSLTWDKRNA